MHFFSLHMCTVTNRMYMHDTMSSSVTLIGAHTLGHAHTAFSGYGTAPSNPPRLDDNAWDNTPASFDNRYYQNLINLPVRVTLSLQLLGGKWYLSCSLEVKAYPFRKLRSTVPFSCSRIPGIYTSRDNIKLYMHRHGAWHSPTARTRTSGHAGETEKSC